MSLSCLLWDCSAKNGCWRRVGRRRLTGCSAHFPGQAASAGQVRRLRLFGSVYGATARQAWASAAWSAGGGFWRQGGGASLQPVTATLSGRVMGGRQGAVTFLVENFAVVLTFLSAVSASVSETQFFGRLLVYQWALTVRLCCLISFSTLLSAASCLEL